MHIDSALTLKSFGPFITPIRANVSKEHKHKALSASASSAHTLPYRQNTMAQAVWNRYCGQQHKYWIDQESWCSIQHICNCNLPLPEAIPSNHFKTRFFSPSLSIFKETQKVSPDDSALLAAAPIHMCDHPRTAWRYSSCRPCPCWMSRVFSISAVTLGRPFQKAAIWYTFFSSQPH